LTSLAYGSLRAPLARRLRPEPGGETARQCGALQGTARTGKAPSHRSHAGGPSRFTYCLDSIGSVLISSRP